VNKDNRYFIFAISGFFGKITDKRIKKASIETITIRD
jgi:hypothetical protein